MPMSPPITTMRPPAALVITGAESLLQPSQLGIHHEIGPPGVGGGGVQCPPRLRRRIRREPEGDRGGNHRR